MKKYKEKRLGMVFGGDIIKIKDSVFDESIRSKCWSKNFVDQIKFLRVDFVSNNGSIRAHDKNKRIYWLSVINSDIMSAYTT